LLLSRAPLPIYLKPFYLTKQLVIVNKESLWLEKRHIQMLLKKENLFDNLQKAEIEGLVRLSMNITKGYPIALCSIIRTLNEGYRDYEAIDKIGRQDLFHYLDRTLFIRWQKRQIEAMIKLSAYWKFNLEMAEGVLGEEAKEIIDSIMVISSFFIFTPPDTYEIHRFFLQFLRVKQMALPKEERVLIYANAGKCYEKRRELNEALRCYKEAGQVEKIAELVIYLSENVDGDFIKNSEVYLKELPKEMEEKFPKLLGVKTLLFSYQMKVEESNLYLQKLKKKVEEEKKKGGRGEALKVYVRTLVALPHGTSEDVRKKLIFLSKYILRYGICIENIIPTGNMPSVINGGLDFSKWSKNDKILYPVMKKAVEAVIGKESVGLAEVCMGENLYEKNKKTEAMSYLTRGLSDANYKGSIRIQYAAIGVMARNFQSEGQADTAEGILINIRDKAEEIGFKEILPNIHASLAYCALLKGETNKTSEWMESYAPNEHQSFYITDRFCLFTKARVYVSMGRYMEALYILNILEKYTQLYHRNYLQIEINLLKAIILFRRGEEWEELFLVAVKKATEYPYIHIISDQGAALLPLWRKFDWNSSEIKPAYIKAVTSELKKMAIYYPNYIKEKHDFEELSKKELEVIRLIAEGCTNGEIAARLDISTATVKFHIANLLKKLNAENRIMAVKIASENDLF